ncbi:MAG: tyrosine-type recombinase/integrase [Proteobacteria bacterium]|nr:tyrosine-type recombinase/integrase [Pseudomonadota bacterium]
MPTLPKTHIEIKAIPAPEIDRVEYSGKDDDSGLILRVSPAGTKTWLVRYYVPGVDGGLTRRRYRLGRFPRMKLADARMGARALLAQVDDGADPAQERTESRTQAKGATVNDLSARFFKAREQGKRNGRKFRNIPDERGMAANYIIPTIGKMPIHAVTPADIDKILEAVQKNSSASRANRVLALTRVMFRFAVRKHWIQTNPCDNVERPGEAIVRWVDPPSDGEIRELWRRLEEGSVNDAGTADLITKPLQLVLKLLLVTGQRSSEVSQAPLSEFDLSAGVWIISGDRTKNGKPHKVPLSPLALSLVKEAAALAEKDAPGTKWLFPGWPGRKGNLRGRLPIGNTAPNHAFRRVMAGSKLNRFRVHDFRSICSTQMAELGVSENVISAILNHTVGTVTARHYLRAKYEAPKREALELWASWLEGVLAGGASVVSITEGTN